MKKLIILSLLSAIVSGCAIGGGAYARRDTYQTNGVHTIEKVRTYPFIATGDAVQQIGKLKASNTKTGNAIGVTGLEQETSATNVAPIINSGAEFLGVAAKAFLVH